MSRLFFILLIAVFSFAEAKSGFNLKVNVANLKNSKGSVLVMLYNKDKSIPDEHFNKYYKKEIVNISNSSATAIFKNLKSGKYALVVLHDENSNGKVDKGLMLPKEGIGFSNFSSISLFNKPNFKKASFNLNSNMSKDVKVIYF